MIYQVSDTIIMYQMYTFLGALEHTRSRVAQKVQPTKDIRFDGCLMAEVTTIAITPTTGMTDKILREREETNH